MKIHKTHILLVESHDDTVEMLRLYLGYANYQVTAISACGECLKLARTERFNLYLLGDCCEDGDAFELCRKIRALDSDTPIVFCSAAAYLADRERGTGAGAQVSQSSISQPGTDVGASAMSTSPMTMTPKRSGSLLRMRELKAVYKGIVSSKNSRNCIAPTRIWSKTPPARRTA
jgi:CheY-like chemotaxis protein